MHGPYESQGHPSSGLAARGLRPVIVNPTPWPEMFRFLLGGAAGDDVEEASARGAAAVREADLVVVLDISDTKRLGNLADAVRAFAGPKLVIDHHIPTDDPPVVATHDHYDDGAFESLIEPLNETARTALRLRFVDDLDYDGIAARLGCTTVAARQRVSTAVRTLRESYA